MFASWQSRDSQVPAVWFELSNDIGGAKRAGDDPFVTNSPTLQRKIKKHLGCIHNSADSKPNQQLLFLP